jgi:hypothetical protein
MKDEEIQAEAERWVNEGEHGLPDPEDKAGIWLFDKLVEAYKAGAQEQQQIPDVKAIAIAFGIWILEEGYKHSNKGLFNMWSRTEEGKKLLSKPSQEQQWSDIRAKLEEEMKIYDGDPWFGGLQFAIDVINKHLPKPSKT